MNNTHPHPEWKRLYSEIATLIQAGQTIPYEDLYEYAGIDIRSTRGRAQFHRFAKEMLRNHRLHFECVRNVGYRVVEPSEQTQCASLRVTRAKRRLKHGAMIAGNVLIERLTPEQAAANASVLGRVASMLSMIESTAKEIRTVIGAAEQKRLPSPLLDKAS